MERPLKQYSINVIIRLKRRDDSEFLLSKGTLIGYNALGDEVQFPVSFYEMWNKTNFGYQREWDDKRKMIFRNCDGPTDMEQVYTLPFNEENLQALFDKRKDDKISFVLKDEVTSRAKALAPEPNIKDTMKLFCKPFDYLFNADYISAEMKAQYRQEAIDAGILSAPGEGNVASSTHTRTAAPHGTYS